MGPWHGTDFSVAQCQDHKGESGVTTLQVLDNGTGTIGDVMEMEL